MRFLALFCLACLLAFSAAAQPGKKPATSTKPKPSPTKPKPSPTPVKKPSESAEWEKATSLTADAERVTALRKFVTTFPRSTRLAEAATLISTAEISLGNERLAAGDVDGAIPFFKAAANDAVKPIPEPLFNDGLSKLPANLYFRGARAEAVEIAKILEDKATDNAGQMLTLASFYLSTENGSEAKRLAEAAIKLDANSSLGYQTLGLAARVDFLLDESAAAYAKAIELEPDSLVAKRGLAEMKRSLGKSDEAATLYREILEKDPSNVPVQTGLILSLFDAGKRTEAEAEMTRSLEAVPGNVMLMAGAAYWYAAHDAPDKAVEFARRAIDTDPRFIWSHIALARGLLGQKKAADAERTLLAARRYGNFPTLEYEIATARMAAGYYREAAEELAKSFSVKDGMVRTVLGGRISRESKDLTELVGFERRASIFAPTAADSPENAARLTALLEFKQQLDAALVNSDALAKAADDFIRGDDRMKVHRQIFAASRMLEKQAALPKVVEITRAAVQNVSAGLDDPNAALAVTAAELYEPRAIAAARGEYVDVPTIPRTTLSAVIRGQIEEISGWALFNMDDPTEAVIRLRRAVAVLPQDSAWWRSSTWRLGTALAATGSDSEALEMLVKSYKSSGPNAFRYSTIEALYKKVKGSADGLEIQIGPNPAMPPPEAVAQVAASPTPEADAEPAPAPISVSPSLAVEMPAVVPVATPEPAPSTEPIEMPVPEATPEATPVATPTASPSPEEVPAVVPIASPTPTPSPEATEKLLTLPALTPVQPSPTPVATSGNAELFPAVVITIPNSKTQPSPTPVPPPEATPETTPEPTPEAAPSPDVEVSPSPTPTPEEIQAEPSPTPTATPTPEKQPGDTFVADTRPRFADPKSDAPAIRVKPCKITFSEEAINLQTAGGDLAVIVGREDDAELGDVSAVSSSPKDVSVRRQTVPGMKTRALFVVRPVSERTGVFQVTFEMACAKRDLIVRVR